jgi:signal transduction histidine kinase
VIRKFFTVLPRIRAWIRTSARRSADSPTHAHPTGVVDHVEVTLAAHDWLTLLAVMIRCANGMRHAGAEDDFREFHRAADRMNLIAQQLISHWQTEIGGPELLDLNQLVEESQGMLARAVAPGISLRLELGAVRGSTARARRWDLERILLNLVLNAGRNMTDGGVVVIETSSMQQVPGGLRPPNIRVRPYVRLIVSDSGTASATSARIIPRFSASTQHGSDLGLATVARLVHELNGVLQFESDSESHNRIRVDLPLVSDDLEGD